MKWPALQLQEFCKTGSGGTPSTRKKDLYYGGDIPWVKSGELKDDILLSTEETLTDLGLAESAAKWVPAGSILIAMYGATVGKTALLGIDASTNQAVCNVIPNPNIADSRYLWYALRTSVPKFLARRVGGAQPNISQKIIRETSFPIPSISEQRRIVEILDQADALRKKRTQADAKVARILPALFYKIFGDPAANPRDWKIEQLADHGANVRYGLGQPPKVSEDGIPLIRATNISKGTITAINMIHVDPQDVPIGRNAFLKADEVIVVRSGAYTGDVAQVTKDWEGCVAGYDLVIMPGSSLTGEFLEAYILTSFIQKGYFHNLKARAGQPHLNADQVSAMPVPVIPVDLQAKFAEAVQSIRLLRQRIEDVGQKMNKVFAVLLHHAFTGDLTAMWREAHMKQLLAEMEEQAKILTEFSREN